MSWPGLGGQLRCSGLVSILVLAFCGCARPTHLLQPADLQLALKGESDGALRVDLERQLSFAGLRVRDVGRYRLEVQEHTHSRETGLRGSEHGKKGKLVPCEGELTLSANLALIDQVTGLTLGSGRVEARGTYDFEMRGLKQEELAFSRGNLTTSSEAKEFSQRELSDDLSAKIADQAMEWLICHQGERNSAIAESGRAKR